MKQLKILVLSFVILMFAACPMDYSHSFRFSNNSDTDVYIYLGGISREYGGTLYPDTGVAEVRCGSIVRQGAEITDNYSDTKKDSWKDTLCLFIFDADTFNTYSWKEIQNGYKVLKRYDLSPKDLRALERKISYPPDERMKDMKMYPPYGVK